MITTRSFLALAAGLAFTLVMPLAQAGDYYLAGGAWNHVPKGSVTSRSRLDFKDDLNLKAEHPEEFALGYIPAQLGWIPGLDFSYVRLATQGHQVVNANTFFGAVQLTPGSTVQTSSDVNNLDASIRWPYAWKQFAVSAGFTIARLDGPVVVADPSSQAQEHHQVNQTFPLLSLGTSYSPLKSLRVSARGDYVESGKNKAQTVEGSVYWKIYGPVGLEAGWRQRRFKVVDDNGFIYDARFSGGRAALRLEFSH